MARFYGSVQGGRGEATRLGDTNSGLRVEACSWHGRIIIVLDARDENKGRKNEVQVDTVHIRADSHHGSQNPTGTIFSGTFAELKQVIDWWHRRDEINAMIALIRETE